MKYIFGGFMAAALAALVLGTTAAPRQRVVTVAGVYGESPIKALAQKADAIAIIEPTAQRIEHWNSERNQDWGDGTPDKPSVILNDTLVTVRKVLRGKLDDQVWLRGPGGTVGDVTWHFEDDVDLQAGERYLVFLRWVDTPTEQGSEKSLIIFGQQNGAFDAAGGGWKRQSTGEMVSEDSVLQ
jgi:hypothetical protein